MLKGGTKVFIDKEKFYQMVNLRRAGWAETSLSLLFDCKVPSISAKCKKFYIEPLGKVYTIERIIDGVLPRNENNLWRMSGGEKTCMGRSYKDYLISK